MPHLVVERHLWRPPLDKELFVSFPPGCLATALALEVSYDWALNRFKRRFHLKGSKLSMWKYMTNEATSA